MKISGKTILMTGGGSGIGEALAHRFHDMGSTVIVTGRRKEALEQAISGRENMHAVTLDVSDPAGLGAGVDAILEQFPDIDVLVNNAGIMRFEPLSGARDLADAEATVETNLLGPIRMIDALIDHLKSRDGAVIVNVSSGLGFVPLVAAPTYSATKAGLHAYTVALRKALAGEVEVIEIVPPAVQTGLTPGQESREGYLPLADFIDEVMAGFEADPTPSEILVEMVRPFRFAEANGAFEQTLDALNTFANEARERQQS